MLGPVFWQQKTLLNAFSKEAPSSPKPQKYQLSTSWTIEGGGSLEAYIVKIHKALNLANPPATIFFSL